MRILFITILLLFTAQIAKAETLVYCPKCKNPLYVMKIDIKKGEQLKPEYFVSVSPSIPDPKSDTPMICPLCRSSLNGWDYYMKSQGFKSYSMAYTAVSLLTKNTDGKWLWTPCDMPMLNYNEVK